MYMASLTGAEIASRLPVISAEAMAPLSPGTTARMRASMRVAHALDRRRRSAATGPAAIGASAVWIAPSTKPDAPMPWK